MRWTVTKAKVIGGKKLARGEDGEWHKRPVGKTKNVAFGSLYGAIEKGKPNGTENTPTGCKVNGCNRPNRQNRRAGKSEEKDKRHGKKKPGKKVRHQAGRGTKPKGA